MIRKNLSMLLILMLVLQMIPIAAIAASDQSQDNLVLEETSSSLVFTGTWQTQSGNYNKGKAKFTKDGSAAVSFSFVGNGFKYIGSKTNTGLPINVFVDGQLLSTIDTQSKKTENKTTLFEVSNLTFSKHDVRLEVSGGKGKTYKDYVFNLDTIEVIQYFPSAPSKFIATKNGDSVKLTWNSEEYATGYHVYRVVNSKKERITTEPVLSNYYTDETYGKVFREKSFDAAYFATAVAGDGSESAASKTDAVTFEATDGPDHVKASMQEDTIHVVWDPVAGSSKYRILSSFIPNDKNADSIEVDAISPEASLTVEAIDKDQKLFIRVVALDADGNSSKQSDQTYIIVPKSTASVPNRVSATNENNIPTLTWQPSANAVGYKVYASTKPMSGYTLISGNQLVTETTFTDKTFISKRLPLLSPYYYKVSAVNKYQQESEMSKFGIVFKLPPSSPNPVTAQFQDGIITLEWPQVPNAIEYKVFQYTLSGWKFDLISEKTVTENHISYEATNVHLEKDARYYFNVVTIDAAKHPSLPSKTASVVVPNTKATVPSAVQASNNRNAITLTWEPSVNATGYNVYRAIGDGKLELLNVNGPVAGTTFIDTEFKGRNYRESISLTYQITAVNQFDIESERSSPAYQTVQMLPGPEEVTAVVDGASIHIQWTETPDAAGYQIYRSLNPESGFEIIQSGVRGTDTVDSSIDRLIPENFVYYYAVSTLDSNGNESKLSPVANVEVRKNIATVPVGVQTKVTHNNIVELSWMQSENATGYKVYRSPAGLNQFALISGDAPINATSFRESIYLNNGSDFDYAVSAVNQYAYESALSQPVSVTVNPPAVPSQFTAVLVDDNVQLSWNAVDGATIYKVYSSLSPTQGFEPVSVVDAVYGAQVVALQQLVIDRTFTEDKEVFYAVSQIDASGYESALSNVGAIIIPRNNAAPVSDLNAMLNADRTVTVTWTPSANATGYKLFRSIPGESDFEPINDGELYTSTVFTDGSPQLTRTDRDTSYVYKVIAVNRFNDESTAVEAQVIVPALGYPKELAYTLVDDSVQLNWLAVEGAQGYKVYRADSEDGQFVQINETSADTSFVDSVSARSIVDGATYFYKVSATFYGTLESKSSTPISVFIPSNVPVAPENFASEVVNNVVSLSWSPAQYADKYQIYRAVDDASEYALVGTVEGSVTHYDDSSFANMYMPVGENVRYAISAVNKYGSESPKSIELVVSLQASKAFVVTAVCTEDPTVRNWIVVNPNSFAINFKAVILESGETAEYTIEANSQKTVTANFNELGVVTLQILVNNILIAEKTNAGIVCEGLELVSAEAKTQNQVLLTFNRKVEADTAKSLSNYMIQDKTGSNLSLISVAILPEGNKVELTTNKQMASASYTVTLTGLKDDEGMPLVKGKNTARFTALALVRPVLENILPNGDFEEYTSSSGLADKWQKYASAGVNANYQIVNGPVASGSNAQKLTAQSLPNGGTTMIYQVVPVKAGMSYNFDTMLKIENLKNARVELFVELFDSANKRVGSGIKDTSSITNGFELLETLGKIPANATYAKVYVIMRGTANGGEGTIVVDSVRFALDPNLLANGGFETYSTTSGVADGWNKYISNTATGTIELVQSTESGGKVQKLTANGSGTVLISQKVPLGFGKSVKIDGKLHLAASQSTRGQLFVEFLNSSNTIIKTSLQELSQPTTGFQELSLSAIIPAGTTQAIVYVVLKGSEANSTGLLYADDLRMQVSDGPIMAGSDPQNNALVEPYKRVYSITFDEPIVKGKNFSNISIVKDGAIVNTIPTISDKTLSLLTDRPLSELSRYSINVPINALEDNQANGNLDPIRIDFATGSKNKARNADFEEYSNSSGIGSGWTKYASSSATAVFELDSNQKVSGNQSQKMSVHSLPNGGSSFIYQDIPVVANQTYRYMAHVNVLDLNNAKAEMFIELYDAANKRVSYNVKDWKVVTSGFESYELIGKIPSNASYARVYVAVRGISNGASGSLLVDAISFSIDPNTLVNPGFEAYTNESGTADGWTKYYSSTVSGVTEIVRLQAAEGSQSQKLTASGLGTALIFQRIDVTGGKDYSYSAQLLVEKALEMKAQIFVEFYNSSNVLVRYDAKELSAATSEYTSVLVNGNIPLNATYAKVYVVLKGATPEAKGSIIADDLRFEMY